MLEVVQSFWESPGKLKPGSGQTRTRQTPDGSWAKMSPLEDYASLVSDAFYVTARNGHIDVASFLLEHGADINYRGFFGGTGLHWAAIDGHKQMVEFLLAHGADISLRDQQHNATALGWAREGNQTEIAELLRRHEEDSGSSSGGGANHASL